MEWAGLLILFGASQHTYPMTRHNLLTLLEPEQEKSLREFSLQIETLLLLYDFKTDSVVVENYQI